MNIDGALTNVDALTQPQAAALSTAIAARLKLLKVLHAARVSALVTVGCTIRIRDNMRPKEWCGLTGVVRSMDEKAATLVLDTSSATRLGRQQLDGIPLSALEAVDPAQAHVDVVDFLLNQATLPDLRTLDRARAQRIAALAADVTAGDQVMVIGASPKFLVGLTGRVESVDKGRSMCGIQLDEESTANLRYEHSPKYPVPDGATRYPLLLKFTQVLITSRS